MPRYVYECPTCSKIFEVEKSIAHSGNPECCPACQVECKRVFTAPAIMSKGSGSSGIDSGSSCPSGGCCSGGSCGFE